MYIASFVILKKKKGGESVSIQSLLETSIEPLEDNFFFLLNRTLLVGGMNR